MKQDECVKTGAKISLFVFGILLLGSLIFWKERMLFIDDAFIAFDLIRTKNFSIPLSRYGAGVSQLLPLLALKLHASVKTILILYSLSFNLFFLAAAYILYRLRQFSLVVLLALYFTIYVSDTFYWTNNENRQGITWLFLDFGILMYLYGKYSKQLKKFIPLSLLFFIPLTALSVYTHPLIMIVFIFMWGFFILKKEPFFMSGIAVFYGLIGIAICMIKYIASTKNGYDPGIMSKVTEAGFSRILQTFKSPLADDFWHTGLANYWWLWILFFMGCGSLLYEKKYLLLFYVLASCVGYFILICLAFPLMPVFIPSANGCRCPYWERLLLYILRYRALKRNMLYACYAVCLLQGFFI